MSRHAWYVRVSLYRRSRLGISIYFIIVWRGLRILVYKINTQSQVQMRQWNDETASAKVVVSVADRNTCQMLIRLMCWL